MKIKHIFFFMMCLILLVIPASASEYTTTAIPEFIDTDNVFFQTVQNFSYDASLEGNRIARVYFDAPMDATVTFTLFYGNNTEVAGSIESHRLGILNERVSTTLTLGGITSVYNYVNINPFYEVDIAGYAKVTNDTSTTGFLLYSYGYGTLDNNNAAFFPVTSLSQNTIYRIDADCTQPFSSEIVIGTHEAVAGAVGTSVFDVIMDYINFGILISTVVLTTGFTLFAWFKFFFVDNIGMTIALYLTVTMVFAARAARGDMQKFLRQWFKDQVGFFQFIIGLINSLVTIISNVRRIF